MGSLKTTLDAYRIIRTHVAADDGTENTLATTGFIPTAGGGTPTNAFDLASIDKAGEQTEANAAVIIVYATASDADTCSIEYYGYVNEGPPEFICNADYIFGTAQQVAGGTILWADVATVTSYHTSTIGEGGASTNDVKRISFDMTGFRYIRAIVTARSGADNIIVLARFF